MAIFLAGIASASGLFAGRWQRLSLLTGSVVLLIAFWSLFGSGVAPAGASEPEPLSLLSAVTFLLLSVGILSLRKNSRYRVAITACIFRPIMNTHSGRT